MQKSGAWVKWGMRLLLAVEMCIGPMSWGEDTDVPEGMVLIPGGTNSGTTSEYGTYSLTVKSFWMDRTEVTYAHWKRVYNWALEHGYQFDNPGSGKGANHPVQEVNWYDCVKWCNARSEMEGRTPTYTVSRDGDVYRTGRLYYSPGILDGSGYRLPTNEEWEYAARGGLRGCRFPWGDTISHEKANYCAYGPYPFEDESGNVYVLDEYDLSSDLFHPTADDGRFPFTLPVGSFAPNGFGLYDMAGNIGEWTHGSGGQGRDIRGGNWMSGASDCLCGRYWKHAIGIGYASSQIGFRSCCRLSSAGLVFRLHGNGVTTEDGREVVDVAGEFGTGMKFPTDLFTRSENLPGDVSGRLLGWYPGTQAFDGTQTSVKDLLKDLNQGVWLEEKDIEEWKRLGRAEETEDGTVIVHFQAVWQSDVQVRVCNSTGGTLTPAELVNVVKFYVHHDDDWRKGEWTVQVPPGEQRLLVEFESGYEARYTATLWKNRVEMEPTVENAWIWNIPSAEGPQTVFLVVRVGPKEETGWLEFDLSGKLTTAQAKAWGEKLSPFDEKKVLVRIWPAGVWNGKGMLVDSRRILALPAGTWRAEFEYECELAGGHPYWSGPGRETIIKDGIVVSPGEDTKVQIEFLPFGTEVTDFYWIEFDGNGGNLSGDVLRWFGRWYDTGGASLNVRALPKPTRAGGWQFTGWYTPGGKEISDWRELEDYLRYESLGNLTLTADWKAVADAATGSGVPVPNAWLSTYAGESLTENGGDFEAASLATAANGMAVWECYLAGLAPTDTNASFKAELVQEEEKLKPRPKGGEKEGRMYRVWGKKEMDDEEWTDVTAVENLEAEGWRFFRVGVEMAE